LQGGVNVLRGALKHPGSLPPEEVRYWQDNVGRWRTTVEQIAIPYLRKRGAGDLAETYAELVREAVALEDQLRG
jgi:hypothetical protein